MMTKTLILNTFQEWRSFRRCLKNWVKVKLANMTRKNPLVR
jgi:hypothetical protein